MPELDAAGGPLRSPQFQSALLVVAGGTIAAILIYVLLPLRSASRLRERLHTAGLRFTPGNTREWSVPSAPDPLRAALVSRLTSPSPASPASPPRSNPVRIHGLPSSHWNVNRIHPMAFDEALVHVEPGDPGSSRVRWSCRFHGSWRAGVTLAASLAVVSILVSLGEAGRQTAPRVIPLLVAFSAVFFALRVIGQNLATRSWFELALLEAFESTRSHPTPDPGEAAIGRPKS